MDHSAYLKSLGGVIKLLRKYHKKTQLEMAVSLDINDRTLRRFEEGRKNMTLEMLGKITEYFGLTASELVKFVTHYYQNSTCKRSYAELFCYSHTRLFILKHPHISIIQTTSNLITQYGSDLFFNRKKNIDKFSCPVLEVDDNFSISWSNQTALNLIGFDPIGMHTTSKLVEKDPNTAKSVLMQRQKLLRGDASMGYSEANFMLAHGEKRVAQIQFGCRNLDGLRKPVIMSFVLDVTDFRRSEKLIVDLFNDQHVSLNKPILIVF